MTTPWLEDVPMNKATPEMILNWAMISYREALEWMEKCAAIGQPGPNLEAKKYNVLVAEVSVAIKFSSKIRHGERDD